MVDLCLYHQDTNVLQVPVQNSMLWCLDPALANKDFLNITMFLLCFKFEWLSWALKL